MEINLGEFEKKKCKCGAEFERPKGSNHKKCWNCTHGIGALKDTMDRANRMRNRK